MGDMETTTTTAPEITTWFKGRDDYGRTTHSFYTNANGQTWGCKAVVVALPAPARKPGRTHLVNIWADPDQNVSYEGSLLAAKAHAEAEVARLAQ